MRLFNNTSLQEYREAAEVARRKNKGGAVVVRVVAADHTTPIAVYANVFRQGGPTALLESVVQGNHVGRYSVIAGSPFLRFASKGSFSRAKFLRPSSGEAESSHDPLAHLRRILQRYTPVRSPGQPRFCCGAIGYIGFEALRLVEPTVPLAKKDVLGLPDVWLNFYDECIIFDHARQSVYLCVTPSLASEANEDKSSYEEAMRRLEKLEGFLAPKLEPLGILAGVGYPISSNRSAEQYRAQVVKAKKHIAAGDVFQLVLSQRFETKFTGCSLEFYRHLRRLNPSPYLFHLDFGQGLKIVGASPEVMVDIEGRSLRVRPIAGTRPRGWCDEQDQARAEELRADTKEIAEHSMLVDLARNDVGRSAVPGTVKVTREMAVEYYSTVMHLVSDVRGELSPDIDPLTAFLRCLPAGTLTGTPKVRACELIAEIEGEKRGPYGGAVGCLTADNFDTGILIRSAVIEGEVMRWQAGGGIVADSDPEAEYQESLAKAQSIGRLLNPDGDAGESRVRAMGQLTGSEFVAND